MNERGFQSKLWIVILLVICAAAFYLIKVVADDSLESGKFDPSLVSKGEDREAQPKDIISRIDSKKPAEEDRQRVVIDDIDPSANEYMGIKARLRDAYTNEPICNATLWYRKASEGPLRDNLSAGRTYIIRDYKGIVRLFDLEPGTYSIAVKAQGYETYYEDDIKVPQKALYHLFKLSRGTFIEGRVLTSDGTPAGSIPVFLSVELANPDDEAPARRAAQSDGQGKFLFGGLPPGTYKLYLKSMQQPLTVSDDIYLTKGGSRTLDLYMPPLHTVEISVFDPFGSAVVNADIKFYEKTLKASYRTKTDYYGKARCELVPPGEYSIHIWKNTYKRYIEESYTILPGSDIIRISRVLERE